jgi:hypothetical protein
MEENNDTSSESPLTPIKIVIGGGIVPVSTRSHL